MINKWDLLKIWYFKRKQWNNILECCVNWLVKKRNKRFKVVDQFVKNNLKQDLHYKTEEVIYLGFK